MGPDAGVADLQLFVCMLPPYVQGTAGGHVGGRGECVRGAAPMHEEEQAGWVGNTKRSLPSLVLPFMSE